MNGRYAPGPWFVAATSAGFQIARVWTSGLYQVLRDSHVTTEAEARAKLAQLTGSAA